MEAILEKLKELQKRLLEIKALLNIKDKIAREQELRLKMLATDFWNDQETAVKVGQEAEELASEISKWLKIETEIRETQEMTNLAKEEATDDLTQELEKKTALLEKYFSQLEFFSLFSGAHDKANAFISIHAGTGGVDAQDWAQMLERMYLRFSERKNFKA